MVNNKIQLQFLVIILSGTLLLSLFILSPFLAPLVLAVVFAVVLHPIYRKIVSSVGNRKALAAAITVFLSFVCILIPFIFLGSQIFNEAVQLYGSFTQENNKQNLILIVIDSAGKFFENVLPGTGSFFVNLSDNLDFYIKQGLTWLINHLGVALSSISSLLLGLFIFLISFYYLLLDGPSLEQAIIKLSPLNDEDDKIVFNRLSSAINSVVKGSLLIALIQGILTAIGFTIFGIPNAVLWGTVAVIAALIPGIGTSLVLLPGVIFLFVVGSPLSAIGLIVWGSLAVGLIDNTLYPKLVGNSLQLHPLFVLLSVLGGITLFGPIGIFLGPITISLLFAFIYIYSIFMNNSKVLK